MALRYLLLLTLLASAATSYNILVYSPTISRSHMLQNGRIADTLALDGHNVTLLELDLFEVPGSLPSVSHAHFWPLTFDWRKRERVLAHQGELLTYSVYDDYHALRQFISLMHNSCLAFLKNADLLEQIRSRNFDAIIYEQFDWCPVAISHLLDIKVKIWTSSCPLMEHQASIMGVPYAFSYVPASINNNFSDKMTYFERLWNVVRGTAEVMAFHHDWNRAHHDLEELFGRRFPSLIEQASTADLLLINTDELIDFPRPLPPNAIHVGGLGLDNKKYELPVAYQSIMQRGKNGVVYFSLGTIAPTDRLPKDYMANILKTFEKFTDHQFIVKLSKTDYNSMSLAKNMSNVYVSAWVPQAALLSHPRLKLFITHGGYNSIMEASRHALPLLLIGMFGDQPRNAQVIERNGWGLSLCKMSLLYGSDEFEDKIRRLLTHDSFKQNAKRIQKLLATKPQTGEQRLTSYIRFLEQNGGKLPELHSVAPSMSFIAYHNIDVLASLIIVVLAILSAVVWFFARLLTILPHLSRPKHKSD